ncbi:unnamed protein product [Ceratitis capitata]|uniref:(Mediterranean fruit fly) hypothetical protein n=1 Tax=Ceratitis capitata TaxID=7213 RepID=A0A811V6D5_CERCA|nr:unnamed protein product [Ceratitis capitata]
MHRYTPLEAAAKLMCATTLMAHSPRTPPHHSLSGPLSSRYVSGIPAAYAAAPVLANSICRSSCPLAALPAPLAAAPAPYAAYPAPYAAAPAPLAAVPAPFAAAPAPLAAALTLRDFCFTSLGCVGQRQAITSFCTTFSHTRSFRFGTTGVPPTHFHASPPVAEPWLPEAHFHAAPAPAPAHFLPAPAPILPAPAHFLPAPAPAFLPAPPPALLPAPAPALLPAPAPALLPAPAPVFPAPPALLPAPEVHHHHHVVPAPLPVPVPVLPAPLAPPVFEPAAFIAPSYRAIPVRKPQLIMSQ